MRWSAVLFCVLAMGTTAGQAPPSLASLKQKVLQDLNHLPNCTCTETVQRSYRPPGMRLFDRLDRVRVEVGYINGEELYSRPGGDALSERDLTRLVSGMISTGDFVTMARNLFSTTAADFVPAGEEVRGGRGALRYDFKMPASMSYWVVRQLDREAEVGYHGSFWVAKDSSDLIELNFSADDIPKSLGFGRLDRILEYARVRIGESSLLLPSRAVMLAGDLLGNETKVETQFHNCRQYVVETLLHFDRDLSAEDMAAMLAAPLAALPDEFQAELWLEHPLDAAAVRVGRPFTARLRESIEAEQRLAVPKGATLHGWVARQEPTPGWRSIGFVLSHFEAGGRRIDIGDRRNDLKLGGRPSGETRPNHDEGIPSRLPMGYPLLLTSTAAPESYPLSPAAQDEVHAGAPVSSAVAQQALDRAGRRAADYISQLPNFLCMQTTRNYFDPSGRQTWRTGRTVAQLLQYLGGQEEYSEATPDPRPQASPVPNAALSSTGEFGGLLKMVFAPEVKTSFQWKGASVIEGEPMFVYSFRASRSRARYSLVWGSFPKQVAMAGFEGVVYIDQKASNPRRVEIRATELPTAFPMRDASMSVRYDYVTLGGRSYLLPTRAETSCRHGKRSLLRNEIEFSQYRKYTAESKVNFELPHHE